MFGWRGSQEAADAETIRGKIQKFLANYNARNESQVSSSAEVDKCKVCNEPCDLILHLQENDFCLSAYVKHFLPATEQTESGNEIHRRRSIFLLSAVLGMCARAQCGTRKYVSFLGAHLGRSNLCLDHYRREGAFLSLPKWNPEASAAMSRMRKNYLKLFLISAASVESWVQSLEKKPQE